jgi:hypothetical protein
MIRFTDGPAADVALDLRRAPVLLRVVRNRKGEWDGLDQFDDTPRPGETVYAYRKIADQGKVHVQHATGRGRRCSWVARATYAVVDPEPAEEVMRDTAKWREWCERKAVEEKGPG